MEAFLTLSAYLSHNIGLIQLQVFETMICTTDLKDGLN